MRPLARFGLAYALEGARVFNAIRRAAHAPISSFSYGSWNRSRSRILIIDTRVPDPRFGAGHPRARMLYDELCKTAFNIEFYTTQSGRLEVSRFKFALNIGGFYCGSKKHLPIFLKKNAKKYAMVIISRPDNLRALLSRTEDHFSCFSKKCLWVYDAEAIWASKMRNSEEKSEHAANVSDELSMAGCANLILSVSEEEASQFRDSVASKVIVVGQYSNTLLLDEDLEQRRDILFVGRLTGTRAESPNVDSLIWFIDEVMPLLDKIIGDKYNLHIAGIVASVDMQLRFSSRIKQLGNPQFLTDLYASSRIFIVPTRTAAGLPTKLIDACSAGLPCVATSLTAQQAGLSGGTDVLLADTAIDFASACARLYQDNYLWSSIRNAASVKMKKRFSREVFSEQVKELVNLTLPS